MKYRLKDDLKDDDLELVIDAIQYTAPDHAKRTTDNCKEVIKFIGRTYDCPKCHGYGEYETEHGPKVCALCHSRLIAIQQEDQVLTVDWGDWIVKWTDGSFIIYSDRDFSCLYERSKAKYVASKNKPKKKKKATGKKNKTVLHRGN